MNYSEIKAVITDHPGELHKFVVCVVSDGTSEKIVVRAKSWSYKYHSDIVKDLRSVCDGGITVSCVGGGQIRINDEFKTVRIWDDSASFGEEPDRQMTKEMLQVEFPGYEITIG